MPTVRVNGAEIYHEVRGSGPPVLLVMGATGDAAALLGALGLAPAAVFGASSGAVFALGLLVRHPEAVRGAVLHEPPLFALSDDPVGVHNALTALVTEGMADGGPPAALERFWRYVAGDPCWEGLDDGLRRRMQTSAETFLAERQVLAAYRPEAEVLAGIAVPVQVLTSEQSRPFFQQAAHQLAEWFHVPVTWTPGAHTPYHDHPLELTQAIRPFLRQVSGVGRSDRR